MKKKTSIPNESHKHIMFGTKLADPLSRSVRTKSSTVGSAHPVRSTSSSQRVRSSMALKAAGPITEPVPEPDVSAWIQNPPPLTSSPSVIFTQYKNFTGVKAIFYLSADKDQIVIRDSTITYPTTVPAADGTVNAQGLKFVNTQGLRVSLHPVEVWLYKNSGSYVSGRIFGPGSYDLSKYWVGDGGLHQKVDYAIIKWARGWRAFPNVDHNGHDITSQEGVTLEQAIAKANTLDNCKSFNFVITQGSTGKGKAWYKTSDTTATLDNGENGVLMAKRTSFDASPEKRKEQCCMGFGPWNCTSEACGSVGPGTTTCDTFITAKAGCSTTTPPASICACMNSDLGKVEKPWKIDVRCVSAPDIIQPGVYKPTGFTSDTPGRALAYDCGEYAKLDEEQKKFLINESAIFTKCTPLPAPGDPL